jgi:Holliday junction resolvase-like predicted endonuclease
MQEQGTLIIVEVRYRKNARYGSAVESVTVNK